jgi:DNA-binding transcriptional LysR family regulator
MALEARKLGVLLAVVRHGGVVDASAALHLTPQAVSLQITALEQQLGVTLFDRATRRLVPTQLAVDLAVHAERIESELLAAEHTLAHHTGAVTGVVRVAAFVSAIRWLVIEALPRIRRQASGITIEVVELHGESAERALRTGAVDLVIAEADAARPTAASRALRHELLQVDPYRVLVPPQWRTVARTAGALLAQPWIAGPPDYATYHALQRLAAKHHTTAQIAHTCLEFPALIALVEVGEGSGIIPMLALKDVRTAHIVELPQLGARHLLTVQRSSRQGTEPTVDAVIAALHAS